MLTVEQIATRSFIFTFILTGHVRSRISFTLSDKTGIKLGL
ncbi:MAG TPA: hypothetical protein VMU10_02755 [Desulfomonilia bacterium]|nr:hypothetical protein [Desulfomonilia bacterium]